MFVDGDGEDAVGKGPEAASNDAATAAHLHMADDPRQAELVRLGTWHVASFDKHRELLDPAGRVSLLHDVAVRPDDYHRRVWCSSLHTNTSLCSASNES